MIYIEREGRGLSKNAALNMSACGNDVQDMLMSLDKSARKSRMVGDRPCIEMCLDQMYVPHLVTRNISRNSRNSNRRSTSRCDVISSFSLYSYPRTFS